MANNSFQLSPDLLAGLIRKKQDGGLPMEAMAPPEAPMKPNLPPPMSDTPDTDAMRQHINEMPKREDNKLSGIGTALAALAAAGTGFTTKNPGAAVSVARDIEDQPFNKAMASWQAKTQPMEKMVGSEITREGMTNRKNIAANRDATTREGQASTAATAAASLQARIDRMNQEHADRMAGLKQKGATEEQKLAATKEWHDNLGKILQQNADTKGRAVDTRASGSNAPVKATEQVAAHKLAMQTVMQRNGIEKDAAGNYTMSQPGKLWGTNKVPIDEAMRTKLNKELDDEKKKILGLKRGDLQTPTDGDGMDVEDPEEEETE